MRKARIEYGLIYEILEADHFLLLNPSQVWVDCGPDARIGWTWDGSALSAPVIPPPTQNEILLTLVAALEAHYDITAKERRYDSRLTCALRAGFAGPFQAEGTAFAIWMDNCNALGYQVMADCLVGLRPIPTAEELVAEMPAMVWPRSNLP